LSKRELDILLERHPREQPVILEDDAAIEAGGDETRSPSRRISPR
jgi:hypothetical protein